MSALLERNVFRSRGLRLFVACVVLSLLVFLLQNFLEIAIGWALALAGLPSRLQQIQDFQSRISWVSPVVVAPLTENFLCLLAVRGLSPILGGGRWRVPLVVALIAAVLHVISYREIVYASIFVNFFAIAALIHNVEGRARGFWASVLVHALTNLLVLIQLRLFVVVH